MRDGGSSKHGSQPWRDHAADCSIHRSNGDMPRLQVVSGLRAQMSAHGVPPAGTAARSLGAQGFPVRRGRRRCVSRGQPRVRAGQHRGRLRYPLPVLVLRGRVSSGTGGRPDYVSWGEVWEPRVRRHAMRQTRTRLRTGEPRLSRVPSLRLLASTVGVRQPLGLTHRNQQRPTR